MPRNYARLLAASAAIGHGRRLYNNARWAYRVGSKLYYGRNRGRVMRRGMRTARKYRRIARGKRQRFGRSTFGFSPGSQLTRRHLAVETYNYSLNTRVLNVNDLTQIAQGPNLNQREYDMIYVSGYKISMQLRSGRPDPSMFHVALIAPREYCGVAETPNFQENFFRGFEQTRGIDFSTALASQQFHEYPINSDKFHIFWHKRFVIGPEDTTSPVEEYNVGVSKNWKWIKKYVPIKRQIRFENGTAGSATNRIYLVQWGDLFLNDPASTPQGWLTGQKVITLYFKDSREK